MFVDIVREGRLLELEELVVSLFIEERELGLHRLEKERLEWAWSNLPEEYRSHLRDRPKDLSSSNKNTSITLLPSKTRLEVRKGQNILQQFLNGMLIELADVDRGENLEVAGLVVADLLPRLRRDSALITSLSPRQFEQLIAEILASHGWEVTLTPESKDGGYDIFGISKDPAGVSSHWLIECKRYRQDRKVGVDIVRSLWGVANQKSNIGAMVATTSDFTRGAKEFKASVYNMDLRNYSSVLDWINEYKPHPEGKLYIKENRLVGPGEG